MMPTAQHIEQALQQAATATGEDFAQLLAKRSNSRARLVALDALTTAFDGNPIVSVARLLKFAEADRASAVLAGARTAKWWPTLAVDAIVGDLVAAQYGERGQ